jgi:hypothetical protein
MNEPYFINLSKHFKDKNNDTLSYTNTPIENISVNINNGIAFLQPEHNFLGIRKVIFTASDNKGGKAKTPEIILNVIKRESLLKLKQNYLYILIAIIILTAFILFLIFGKADSDEDTDDDIVDEDSESVQENIEQEKKVIKKKIIIRKK